MFNNNNANGKKKHRPIVRGYSDEFFTETSARHPGLNVPALAGWVEIVGPGGEYTDVVNEKN